MRDYALSTAALSGEVVTEGHSRYCREHGHATHRVDGEVSIFCPRCGEEAMSDTAAWVASAPTLGELTERASATYSIQGNRQGITKTVAFGIGTLGYGESITLTLIDAYGRTDLRLTFGYEANGGRFYFRVEVAR